MPKHQVLIYGIPLYHFGGFYSASALYRWLVSMKHLKVYLGQKETLHRNEISRMQEVENARGICN